MKKFYLQTILLFVSAFLLFDCTKNHSVSQTSSGNWKSIGQIPGLSRYGASSWVIGDTGYLVGGFNSIADSSLSDLWQFDPVKSSWVQKAYFPGGARHAAVAFAIGTNGYLATGISDNNQRFQDCWQYNPSTNTWTKMANLPDANFMGSGARYDAVAFTIGNYGYVGTGIGNSGLLNDFWKFDAVANSWTSIPNAPTTKRCGAVAFTTFNDTAAYLVTGTNEGGVALTDFWRYSPSSGWTQLKNITNNSQTDITRTHAVALVQPNNGVWKAYITTGEANFTLIDKTWEYDFVTDSWKIKTPFSEEGRTRSARKQAVAWSFINLQRAFVGTGNNNIIGKNGTPVTSFDDVAEWFPVNSENAAD